MSDRRGLVGKELKPASQGVKAGPGKPPMGQSPQGALISKQPVGKKDPKDPKGPAGAVSRNTATAAEVAERLKVSEEAIKEWLKKGLLKGNSSSIQNYELEKFKAGFPGEITRAQKHRIQLSDEMPAVEEPKTKKIQLKKATPEKPEKGKKADAEPGMLMRVISLPGQIVSAVLEKLSPSKKKRSKEDAAAAFAQMGLGDGKIPPRVSPVAGNIRGSGEAAKMSRKSQDSGQLKLPTKSSVSPPPTPSGLIFDDEVENHQGTPSREIEQPVWRSDERPLSSSPAPLEPDLEAPRPRGQPSSPQSAPPQRKERLSLSSGKLPPMPPSLPPERGAPAIQREVLDIGARPSTPDRTRLQPPGARIRGAEPTPLTAPPPEAFPDGASPSPWASPVTETAPATPSPQGFGLGAPIQPSQAPVSPARANDWLQIPETPQEPPVVPSDWLSEPAAFPVTPTGSPWAPSGPVHPPIAPVDLPPLLDPFSPHPAVGAAPLAPLKPVPPETSRTQEELTRVQSDLSQERQQKTLVESRLAEALQELEQRKSELLQKSQGDGLAQRKIQELSAQLQAAQTHVESSKAQIRTAESQLASTQAQVQSLDARLKATESQMQVNQAVGDTAQSQLQAYHSRLSQSEAQLQASQAQLQTSQSQLQTRESQIAALQAETQLLRVQIQDALRAAQENTVPPEALRNLESELWGAREALEGMRSQHSESVRQVSNARARLNEAEQRLSQQEQEQKNQFQLIQSMKGQLKEKEDSLAVVERQQLATQRENLVLLRERQEGEKQWQQQLQEVRLQLENEQEHNRVTEDKYSQILAQKDKELRELQKKQFQQGPTKEEFGVNQAELEETKNKLVEANKRLKILEQKHSTQIQRWEKELQAAGTWVGKLTEAVQVKDKRIVELEGLLAQNQARSKSAEDNQVTAQLMTARVELNSLKRHYETAQQTVRAQERELQDLKNEKTNLQSELENSRGTASTSAEKGPPLLQQELRHSQELVKQLETEVVATIVKLAAVEREKLDLEARLRELSGDV